MSTPAEEEPHRRRVRGAAWKMRSLPPSAAWPASERLVWRAAQSTLPSGWTEVRPFVPRLLVRPASQDRSIAACFSHCFSGRSSWKVARESLEDVDGGFALLPQFRSQGYAYEAAAATLAYGRQELGLSRVVAVVSPTNDASTPSPAKARDAPGTDRPTGTRRCGGSPLRPLPPESRTTKVRPPFRTPLMPGFPDLTARHAG